MSGWQTAPGSSRGSRDCIDMADEFDTSTTDVLGVAEGVLDTADPIAIMRSLQHAVLRAAVRPQAVVPAFARFSVRLMTSSLDVTARMFGSQLSEPVAVDAKDARFRDPAWAQNPVFRLMLEWYLAATRLAYDIVEAGSADDARPVGPIDRQHHPNGRCSQPRQFRRAVGEFPRQSHRREFGDDLACPGHMLCHRQ